MDRARHLVGLLVVTVLLASASACGGSTSSGSTSSGGRAQSGASSVPAAAGPANTAPMCSALTIADLSAEGLKSDRSAPETQVTNNGASTYCAYAGQLGDAGAIELDVFSPVDYPKAVEPGTGNAPGDVNGTMTPAGIPGVDDSTIGTSVTSGGSAPFALVIVHKGKLVFVLSIPTSQKAHDQLISLATKVLKRIGT
jgi:hypothetical protein